MSAFGQVEMSAWTVVSPGRWALFEAPETGHATTDQGDGNDARAGSSEEHSGCGGWRTQADDGAWVETAAGIRCSSDQSSCCTAKNALRRAHGFDSAMRQKGSNRIGLRA